MKKLIQIILFMFLCLPVFFADANTLPPKTISLNFADIPVKQVLQIFAQHTDLNIIISDRVTGNMTIHLDNMPWQQALQVILEEKNLGQQQIGNVILIAPLSEIAQRQAQQFQIQEQIQNEAPLQSVLIPIHYAKADILAGVLKNQTNDLLSTRGSVNVDTRTNTLWIQDTPEKLNEISKLIQKLDIPIKQVLIEARIVSIDEKYEQELGIRFGLTRPGNNLTGTFSGANALAGNTNPASISNPLDRLNVDLPAANTGNPNGAASMGLALATLGGGTLLDLELSALESEGGGEIISSPQLMTANEQPATILSGQEIPYQQSIGNGATSTSFQKAVLSLTVTPQITPQGKLILTLQVNQDRPSTTLIKGVPAIETRQIQTQVLVDNGQTIVLGGIYEQNKQNQVERVPFLGELPYIGSLFRHTYTKKDRRELLIFVTPKVVSG